MKGIDVSKWQGHVNWRYVKEAGYDFAVIRDGYGKTGIDKMFEANYRGAREAGLFVGAYHYSYADSVSEARKEAEFCLKLIAGKKFEFPIVYDIEDAEMLSMTTRQRTECCYAFCEAVETAGYYAMIYANPNWLKNYLHANELLSRFDLWLAQWNNKAAQYPCGIRQHSETGRVSGVIGNVDLNEAYKDYPSIMKERGINGFGKSQQTETPKTTKYYTVVPGDNLTKIAVKYGTTIDKIAKDNGIIDKNKIYAGQVLRV